MYVDEKREGELLTPSLPGFISWLERQDASKSYDWVACGRCACAQYAKHLGGDDWYLKVQNDPVWAALNQLAKPHPFTATTDTFGNLLARSRDALLELQQ